MLVDYINRSTRLSEGLVNINDSIEVRDAGLIPISMLNGVVMSAQDVASFLSSIGGLAISANRIKRAMKMYGIPTDNGKVALSDVLQSQGLMNIATTKRTSY